MFIWYPWRPKYATQRKTDQRHKKKGFGYTMGLSVLATRWHEARNQREGLKQRPPLTTDSFRGSIGVQFFPWWDLEGVLSRAMWLEQFTDLSMAVKFLSDFNSARAPREYQLTHELIDWSCDQSKQENKFILHTLKLRVGYQLFTKK